MLAHEANKEPLPPDNGQPLRLVLPGSYAYKNVKWVERVEAIAAEDPGPEGYHGYWESAGLPGRCRHSMSDPISGGPTPRAARARGRRGR